ncbi:hypothetical protein Ddye_013535 [Dipteronia dyeriana]|uniref:Cytochrome P450 n=1 Tax=Dipteronia dyeriana TaxID=168575 RepID=A0AAE0CJR3_9ROSI|nr:hypothetical protein Ddye_013535 [Dipteronia dyeriana]
MEATQLNHNSSIEELAFNITEKTLEKTQYLHAALTETLRLYPAIPTRVKKGQSVTYLPYAMGRMKYLRGDDAEEFRPERWLDESGRFQRESPFTFTAFQAGPRICFGKEFAYMQMKIFCMILLASYKFKLSDENKPVKYRTRLTLQINGGLHLHATSRLIHS